MYNEGCLDIKVGCSEINFFGVVQSVRKVILRKDADFTVYYRCKGRSLMNGLIEFTPNTPLVDVLATKDENDFITVFVEYDQSTLDVGSLDAVGGVEEDNDSYGFEQDSDDAGSEDICEFEDAVKNLDIEDCGWAGPKVLEGCPSTSVGPEAELDHNEMVNNSQNPKCKKVEKIAAFRRKTKSCFEQVTIEDAEPQIGTEDDVLYDGAADEDIPVGGDLFAEGVTKNLDSTVENGLQQHKFPQLTVRDEEVEVREDDDLNEDSEEEGSGAESDDDKVDEGPVFNPKVDFKKNVELKKGIRFESVQDVRKAIRHHAIMNRYDYYFLHNNTRRVSVYCKHRCKCPLKYGRYIQCICEEQKCLFRIHRRKLKLEETWQIKSMTSEHSCGFHSANPKVTSEFLAERYLDHFRDDPNLKLKYFMKLILRDIGVSVKYHKAYYAKVIALHMIHGSALEQYRRVWDYAAVVRKYVVGSAAFVVVSDIERPPTTFQRMYICLQPCKEGFLQGCRHIIGVDGCHLKGQWPGVCLVAVGKDGNNNLFPIAWAVAEVENKDSWTWFLDLLTKDLGIVTEHITWVHENEQLTFMSDRQKVQYPGSFMLHFKYSIK